MSGLSLGSADTLLTQRAADYLAAGPADPQTLISHVCQIPGTPMSVAEHMAAALFAGHQKFTRSMDGRWMLRESVIPSAARDLLYVQGGRLPYKDGRSLVAGASRDDIAAASLHDTPFVVVDCETTGSRAGGADRITEIAVVRVHNGVATRVFDTLVNPERSIPPSVVAITNITWEMVKDAPRFRDICPQLLGVLEGHVFVAHNATFDWRFVSAEIERVTRRPLEGRKLCTVRMARRLLPQLRRRNLDALQLFYGVDNYARHRAGGDAVATAEIFLKMLGVARDHGYETLDDLDRAVTRGASRKKRRRRPPALPHSAADDSSA
jgi:DNA polymerase-3 subunit epsilon